MQLYILMADYGRSREAIVDPEHTRRDIVAQVREIIVSGRKSVSFIKFVDGDAVEDVTAEIMAEAAGFIEPEQIDHATLAADHTRDLRKVEIA